MRFKETMMGDLFVNTTYELKKPGVYSLVLKLPFILALFIMGVAIALLVDTFHSVKEIG